MANVVVSWALPTTRENGTPLKISDIKDVEIKLSADGGKTFGVFGHYSTDVLSTIMTELEAGVWVVGASVRDIKMRESKMVTASITIEETSPPSSVTGLTLSL